MTFRAGNKLHHLSAEVIQQELLEARHKNPNLYFYDTGLAASLLGITGAEQIESFYMRGALFENLVISELLKHRLFAGRTDELCFWRDSNGVEIDVLEEDGSSLHTYEIKAPETMSSAFSPTY